MSNCESEVKTYFIEKISSLCKLETNPPPNRGLQRGHKPNDIPMVRTHAMQIDLHRNLPQNGPSPIRRRRKTIQRGDFIDEFDGVQLSRILVLDNSYTTVSQRLRTGEDVANAPVPMMSPT